jgi:hypothetical protein
MYTKIEIVVDELKDGSLVVKLNGEKVGELGEVKPLAVMNEVHELVTIRERLKRSSKLVNDLDVEIVRQLALLIAWYVTE